MPTALVDVTGATPQTVVAGVSGKRIQLLGCLLTSSDTNVAIVKAGTLVLTRIACAGGGLLPPSADWELIGAAGDALTVESDTAGKRIVGNVTYKVLT